MEKLMEEIVKFLEYDGIDMSKYSANSEIMKNETKEIYQATTELYNQNDISDNATETIQWVASVLNQPLGFYRWFMTAYPDVVKWFSNLDEEMVISIIGNPTKDYMDENNKLKLPILRKIVDAYKISNKLECY